MQEPRNGQIRAETRNEQKAITRVKPKTPSALKHAAYSKTAVLPGEDPAAFDKLCQDLIDEFKPVGALEQENILNMARLQWRRAHLQTYRNAERASRRFQRLVEEYDPHCIVSDESAAKTQIRKEVGEDTAKLVEMGSGASFAGLLTELDVEERLDAMIDRCLKRHLLLKGLRSLTESTSQPQLSAP